MKNAGHYNFAHNTNGFMNNQLDSQKLKHKEEKRKTQQKTIKQFKYSTVLVIIRFREKKSNFYLHKLQLKVG